MRFAVLAESSDYRRMWSGTVNHIMSALKDAGHTVEMLDVPILPTAASVTTLMSKVQRRAMGKDLALDRTEWMARVKARMIRHHLAGRSAIDALLVPVGSTILPFLRTDIPVVYVSDATLPLIIDYYDRYADYSPRTRRRAIALERQALRMVDLGVFPTRWAAASARDDLGLPEDRILIAPFGPNMSEPPARSAVLAPRVDGPLRLLFCAVEWKRKGGNVALDMARHLHRQGREVELTMVGVKPPEGTTLPPNVTIIPYLDKRDPADTRRFRTLFARADLFVLPTRAECFGVVFCEAAAFATPTLATRTGGVGEVVRDGETGVLLPPGADGAAYAAEVAKLIDDPDRLEAMRIAARDDFEDRLNWSNWARTVSARLTPLVAARRSRRLRPSDTPSVIDPT